MVAAHELGMACLPAPYAGEEPRATWDRSLVPALKGALLQNPVFSHLQK